MGHRGVVTLINRDFVVDAPLRQSWQHLAEVQRWPSWASHIRRVELEPEGVLAAGSAGRFHLTNGVRSTFRMVEFNPERNWKWVGTFLWLTVHYDHRFEALDDRRTRLTWVVVAEGLGVSVLGRVFAAIYNGNLSRAIPRLMAELNATPT